MLGAIRSGQFWQWAACGKHPLARDFIRIGHDIPVVKSFSEWVDKGYHLFTMQRNMSNSPVSWRFWAKGVQEGALVLGLIKDSSDSLGRSYPLLIIGNGPLQDWEERWDLLPRACEKPWSELEYLSARNIEDVERLKASMNNILPPRPQWSDFADANDTVVDSEMKSGLHKPALEDGNLEGLKSLIIEKKEIFIDLDKRPFHDHFAAVNYLNRLIKQHNRNAPQAMFLGGTVERSYLALFMRPLTTANFVRLWIAAAESTGG